MTRGRTQTRRHLLRLLACGATLGVAGCSGVDPHNSGPTQGTTEPVTSPEATPVVTPDSTTSQTATPSDLPSDGSTPQHLVIRRSQATVLFSCTEFWIDLAPASVDYYLVLDYLDTASHEQFRFVAGPLRGRVEDSFGSTRFLLLSVEVSVPSEATSVSVHIPRRCLEASTPTASDSTSHTPSP